MAEGKKAWTKTRKDSNASADSKRKTRKAGRTDTQRLAAMENRARGDAELTPWQQACAKRAAKRQHLQKAY